jgi:hypothetical protein
MRRALSAKRNGKGYVFIAPEVKSIPGRWGLRGWPQR